MTLIDGEESVTLVGECEPHRSLLQTGQQHTAIIRYYLAKVERDQDSDVGYGIPMIASVVIPVRLSRNRCYPYRRPDAS